MSNTVAVDSVRGTSIFRPIPGEMHDILRTGNHHRPSRSEAVAAVTLSMVNHGWDWARYHQAMTDPINALSQWFTHRKDGRTRAPHDTARRLRDMWDGRVRFAQEHPSLSGGNAAEVRQEIGLIRAEFRSSPFTGSTSVADGLVLEYFHQVATRRVSTVVAPSSREVGKAVGLWPSTVLRAVKRLVRAGWLSARPVPSELRQIDRATPYKLTVPSARQRAEREVSRRCAGGASSVARSGRTTLEPAVHSAAKHTSSDLFLRLGRYAALVYTALEQGGPMRAAEVAEVAGISTRTAFKYLAVLAASELAESVDGVWQLTEKSTRTAAEELGATGLAQARVERIDQEQANWRLWCSRLQFRVETVRLGKFEAVRRMLARRVDLRTGEIAMAV